LYFSKAKMEVISTRGNEIDRWSFHQAKVIFWKDAAINELVEAIPRYPDAGRIQRIRKEDCLEW
jgi:hypothetical protein